MYYEHFQSQQLCHNLNPDQFPYFRGLPSFLTSKKQIHSNQTDNDNRFKCG